MHRKILHTTLCINITDDINYCWHNGINIYFIEWRHVWYMHNFAIRIYASDNIAYIMAFTEQISSILWTIILTLTLEIVMITPYETRIHCNKSYILITPIMIMVIIIVNDDSLYYLYLYRDLYLSRWFVQHCKIQFYAWITIILVSMNMKLPTPTTDAVYQQCTLHLHQSATNEFCANNTECHQPEVDVLLFM